MFYLFIHCRSARTQFPGLRHFLISPQQIFLKGGENMSLNVSLSISPADAPFDPNCFLQTLCLRSAFKKTNTANHHLQLSQLLKQKWLISFDCLCSSPAAVCFEQNNIDFFHLSAQPRGRYLLAGCAPASSGRERRWEPVGHPGG